MADSQNTARQDQSNTSVAEHVGLQRHDEIKAGLEKLYERVEKLPQDVVDLLEINTKEKPANQDIYVDVGHIQVELTAARQQNGELAAALDAMKAELHDARQQIARIQINEAKLRTIILQQSGTERISDLEMKERFVSIRQKAQAIANSPAYYYQAGLTLKKLKGQLLEEAQEFYSPKHWSQWTLKDRKNHVMAKIFELLHRDVLERKLFNPSIVVYDNNQPVEPDLRYFETFLEKTNIDVDLLASWRTTTMDCMSQLPVASQRSKRVAENIYDFFSPILAKEISGQREDELRSQIADLCGEAVALRIIMRRSKDRYECVFPPAAERICTMEQYEKQVEPLSVEGGKNDQGSNEIAYAIFGGLVKYADHVPRVLEKAQVILKRR